MHHCRAAECRKKERGPFMLLNAFTQAQREQQHIHATARKR